MTKVIFQKPEKCRVSSLSPGDVFVRNSGDTCPNMLIEKCPGSYYKAFNLSDTSIQHLYKDFNVIKLHGVFSFSHANTTKVSLNLLKPGDWFLVNGEIFLVLWKDIRRDIVAFSYNSYKVSETFCQSYKNKVSQILATAKIYY